MNDRHRDQTNVSGEELTSSLAVAVESVAAATPDESTMTAFLDELACRFEPEYSSGPESPKAMPVRHRSRPVNSQRKSNFRRRLVAVAAVAASLLLLLSLFRPTSADALEEIARALAGQSCVKMTTVSDDGTSELWVMLDRDQSAWRNEDWILHYDHATDIEMTYDRDDERLTRSAGQGHRSTSYVVDFLESLAAVGGERAPSQLLGMDVLFAHTSTSDDGREVTVHLDDQQSQRKGKVIITVDPESGLPQSARFTVTGGGRTKTITSSWEYPEHGPADIYAMGVDRQTELIDRVPSTDVKRLVAGVNAGRHRFDDYRAVVVKTNRLEEPHYGPGDVRLVGRRGDDLLLMRNWLSLDDDLQGQSPADVAAAVLAAPVRVVWAPSRLIKGQTIYQFQTVSTGPEFDHMPRVTGFQSMEDSTPRDEFIIAGWTQFPHLAGRPPLGIGRADIASAIATEAADGPEGCVLLNTRRDGRIPEAPSELSDNIRPLNQGGYWIRADRDFLVMQQDVAFSGGVEQSFTLTSLAQSPQGFWYPTSAVMPGFLIGDREIQAEYYRYLLDFETLLPAESFEPESYVQD